MPLRGIVCDGDQLWVETGDCQSKLQRLYGAEAARGYCYDAKRGDLVGGWGADRWTPCCTPGFPTAWAVSAFTSPHKPVLGRATIRVKRPPNRLLGEVGLQFDTREMVTLSRRGQEEIKCDFKDVWSVENCVPLRTAIPA